MKKKGNRIMNDIYLKNLLNFSDEENSRVKIRFNIHGGGKTALENYYKNPMEVNVNMLLWKTKNCLFKQGDIAISFLIIEYDTWLLTTIKFIDRVIPNVTSQVAYETHEYEKFKPYFGRVILRFHKGSQPSVRKYDDIKNDLIITQILTKQMEDDSFPGYDNVSLSYEKLARIIRDRRPEWVNALENQQGVYLITDKASGKLYVGSATSENGMLLKRWRDYINNGHGGDKSLRELVEKKGFDYVKKNFQYSIIENYNSRKGKEFILARETYWKGVLSTKKWGYNNN